MHSAPPATLEYLHPSIYAAIGGAICMIVQGMTGVKQSHLAATAMLLGSFLGGGIKPIQRSSKLMAVGYCVGNVASAMTGAPSFAFIGTLVSGAIGLTIDLNCANP